MPAMNAVDHGHIKMPEGILAAHTRAQRKFDAVTGDIDTHARAKHQMLVIRAEDDLMVPVRRIVLLLAHWKAFGKDRLALWRQKGRHRATKRRRAQADGFYQDIA